MLRLAFDFIITWRETRTRPNAYYCQKNLFYSELIIIDNVILSFLIIF